MFVFINCAQLQGFNIDSVQWCELDVWLYILHVCNLAEQIFSEQIEFAIVHSCMCTSLHSKLVDHIARVKCTVWACEKNVSNSHWFFWVHAIDLFSCSHSTPKAIIRWAPTCPFWEIIALDGLEPVITGAGWFPNRLLLLLCCAGYRGRLGGACVLCVHVRVSERSFSSWREFLRQRANDLQCPGSRVISVLVRHSWSLFSHRLLYSLPSDPQNNFGLASVQFILLHWKW